MPVIKEKEPTEKEKNLLTRIKQLEKELAKIQTEKNHLKLENEQLKSLIRQEKETEVKTFQILPLKANNNPFWNYAPTNL